MPPLPEIALQHAAFRRRLALTVAGEAARLWAQVDPARILESWTESLARLQILLTGAQQAVAGRADGYLDEALDEQGLDSDGAGRVVPGALAGVASDGRPLDTLLLRPVITALDSLGQGRGVARALAGGAAVLDMIVRTQVADAGRVADQVAMAARPEATGYVRMLVGRSCSRCAVLAGRWYASNAGFDRHPRCRPGATACTSRAGRTSPATSGPTRRRSSGHSARLSRTGCSRRRARSRSGSAPTSARS